MPTGLLIKRAFDVGFTTIATLVLLPLAGIVALAIRISSGGPIFYRAMRIGKGGDPFVAYKFRTMVPNAAAMGPGVTHGADPRITRLGRMLRKTKFDEFPQVINVLRGNMSIVGPRPEAPEYVMHYAPEQQEVLRMRPGLTSLAQVLYREEEAILPGEGTEAFYLREVMPQKLALDLYYVRHWSLSLDSAVFVFGVLALLKIPPPSFLWPVSAHTLDRG